MIHVGYTIARLRLTAKLPAEYLNVQTTVTRQECAALVDEIERLRGLVEAAYREGQRTAGAFYGSQAWEDSESHSALDG
jgi:hypothetical protein